MTNINKQNLRAYLAAATLAIILGVQSSDASAQAPGNLPKRSIVISLDNHILSNDVFDLDEQVLRENIRTMLEQLRPRRVMAFAVGHDGHAQYPSQVFPARKPSAAYPNLKESNQDLLQIWKEETTRTATEFYIYVSTLRNDALAKLRPQYLRTFINTGQASVIDHNSTFLEDILLPGLQELIDRYEPDGIFLDADYWTVHESWNQASVAKFSRRYGVSAPSSYADSSYRLFRRFTYESYRLEYVKKLADFFAEQRKSVKWAINAAFTLRDPSPVPDNVGYITIDLPFFALTESHIESLFGQRLNTETEIVYPLFAQPEGAHGLQFKTAAQLRQEMAVAAANGSLLHFYLPLGRKGEILLDKIRVATDVYDELEKEIGFAIDAKKAGVYSSLALVSSNADALIDRNPSAIRNTSIALFEAGIVHSIITDSLARGSSFSHLIFPRLNHVDDANELSSLVREGKKVMWIFDAVSLDESTWMALAKVRDTLRKEEGDACDIAEGAADGASIACAVYMDDASGGALWVVSQSRDMKHRRRSTAPWAYGAVVSFLQDLSAPFTFIDKPGYIYPLAFRDHEDPEKVTIFLTSVAHGGYAIGRHTVFESLDLAPETVIRFSSAKRCKQYSLAGTRSLAPGSLVVAEAFDTITKLVCSGL